MKFRLFISLLDMSCEKRLCRRYSLYRPGQRYRTRSHNAGTQNGVAMIPLAPGGWDSYKNRHLFIYATIIITSYMTELICFGQNFYEN